jgi:2-Cys peroxiredoxin 5
VKHIDALKAKGVSEVICTAVNDPFVMDAWGKAHGAGGKVRMLADTEGKLAHALGIELDLTAALGNKRMKRFSAVVEDGVITKWNVEPDGTGATCSLAENIVKDV